MRLSVAVFSAFLLTGLPTLAAEQPDFETCSKSEEPDLTVASCTRVIDDHTLIGVISIRDISTAFDDEATVAATRSVA